MTNGWIDIKNTDMMLIMGGNPAENHPCGFKWAIEAKRNRNAKMIVVDPRFTRTASTADLFCQIRAGADIAFLGGVIRYAIENNRIAKDYLVNYTNASFIVKEGFKLPEDGLYSGFDPATKVYNKSTWNYEEGGDLTGKPVALPKAEPAHVVALPKTAAPGQPAPPPPTLPPNVAYDLSLQHPRCVFQLLKKQYSRYTPEMVSKITGIPKDQFVKAAELFTSVRKDGDTKKVATIIYAVGWTQHSYGTQIIRTAAMLQLIMGNIGRAGGGMNALRGHSNIQGATDMAGIFDILPGYLKMPNPNDTDFAAYLKRITPTSSKPTHWDSFNYWSNTPKFATSFLKASPPSDPYTNGSWRLPVVCRTSSRTRPNASRRSSPGSAMCFRSAVAKLLFCPSPSSATAPAFAENTTRVLDDAGSILASPRPIERLATVRFIVLAKGLSRQASRITSLRRLTESSALSTRSSDTVSSSTSKSLESLASAATR